MMHLSYKRPAIYAVLLHLSLLILLVVGIYSDHALTQSNEAPPSIQASLASAPAPSRPHPPAQQPVKVEPAPKPTATPTEQKNVPNTKTIPVSPPKPKKTTNVQQQKDLEEALLEEEMKNTPKKTSHQASKELLDTQIQAESAQLNQQATQARSRVVQGEVDQYKTLILQQVQQNWIVPQNVENLSAVVEVELAPGGMVLNARIIKSSGNSALDRSALAAVNKSSPLPVPKDNAAFSAFRRFTITVKPEGMSTSL